MSLAEQIQSDLTGAMKARDRNVTATLRMVLAAIKNLRVAEGRGGAEPSDEEVVELLGKEAKRRREAAEAYRDAGREELAAKEEAELEVIERYLPAQLSEDELRAIIADAVQQTGASEPGDLGKVMGVVMPQVKGQADGKVVNRLVREALGA